MNTVKQDRESLKRLIEAYGKEDVVKFIRHLNESEEPDPRKLEAIEEAVTRVQSLNLTPEQFAKIKMLFESLYDYGYADGFDDGEESSDEEIQSLRKQVSDAGWQYEYDHHDDWRKPSEMGQW